MTVVSVLGRFFFDSPVMGDFELVEVGCAIAVFAALPYCQWYRGNVVVDFFTLRAPAPLKGMLDALGSLTYGLLAALLAWRLSVGGYDMWRYGEETMVLGMARWWGFIPIVASMILLTLVCFYLAGTQLLGRRQADREEGAS
nr:TRAP transporter small permease [Motiliproteus sp. SC1-56]